MANGTLFLPILEVVFSLHHTFYWTKQVIPVNTEGMKAQHEEIEAAKLAALQASTSDEAFVPENVPQHLVQ